MMMMMMMMMILLSLVVQVVVIVVLLSSALLMGNHVEQWLWHCDANLQVVVSNPGLACVCG